MRATNISDVQLPVEYVTLEHLKTKSGEPVVVGCSQTSELAIASILNALPGIRDTLTESPTESREDATPEEVSKLISEAAERMRIAPAIIELGTFLVGPDGEEIRPAFKWGPSPAPSLPGHYLRDGDQIRLMEAVLRAGGYIGGAADDELRFPDDGEGRNGGVGIVEAGARDGEVTVGGSA